MFYIILKKIYLVSPLLLISSILSIQKKEFDLTNEDKYRYASFQNDEVYKFYIKAIFHQNATFEFHTKGIIGPPFSYIFIYEYFNRFDEIEIKKKNLSMIKIDGLYTDSVTFSSFIIIQFLQNILLLKFHQIN